MTTSSTRLRNSGRNVARSASRTFVSISSSFPVPAYSWIQSEPTLLVMMITVLRKLTTRPCPSVSRPSSSTWSSTLNTS